MTYTRDGGFEFGQDGMLTSHARGARVAALVDGALQDFSVAGLRATPAQPTSTVHLIDNLSSGDNAHELSRDGVRLERHQPGHQARVNQQLHRRPAQLAASR